MEVPQYFFTSLDEAILDGMWRYLNTSSPGELEEDNMQKLQTNLPTTFLNVQMAVFLQDGWLTACLDLELIQMFNPRCSLLVSCQRKNVEKNHLVLEVRLKRKLATIKATTRPNAPDRGILLGITKKNVINIAQPENRADVCAHESSLLVLLQSNQSRNHWPI